MLISVIQVNRRSSSAAAVPAYHLPCSLPQELQAEQVQETLEVQTPTQVRMS